MAGRQPLGREGAGACKDAWEALDCTGFFARVCLVKHIRERTVGKFYCVPNYLFHLAAGTTSASIFNHRTRAFKYSRASTARA